MALTAARLESGRRSYVKHLELQRANHRVRSAGYRKRLGTEYAERRRAYDANRVALARAFVDAAIAGGCVDCGTKEQVVLDLDHVRGEKHDSVSHLVHGALSVLFAEIDKCETRCSNCHRRVTALRKQAGYRES